MTVGLSRPDGAGRRPGTGRYVTRVARSPLRVARPRPRPSYAAASFSRSFVNSTKVFTRRERNFSFG